MKRKYAIISFFVLIILGYALLVIFLMILLHYIHERYGIMAVVAIGALSTGIVCLMGAKYIYRQL